MRHYWKPISIVIAIFFAGLTLQGCDKTENVSQVTLSMLTQNAARFDDREILTQGVVNRFEDPLHYWIEDSNLNRVEILPHKKAAAYLGQAVVVKGHFRFSATEGRLLTLTEIKREIP